MPTWKVSKHAARALGTLFVWMLMRYVSRNMTIPPMRWRVVAIAAAVTSVYLLVADLVLGGDK